MKNLFASHIKTENQRVLVFSRAMTTLKKEDLKKTIYTFMRPHVIMQKQTPHLCHNDKDMRLYIHNTTFIIEYITPLIHVII